jgi:hypothetical protein
MDDTPTGHMKEIGMVPNHVYSLLGIYNLDGVTVIKIRNPWGNFEWKGDWSDDSELWTDDYKDICQMTPTNDYDDGTFCMSLKDFKYYLKNLMITEVWEDNILSTYTAKGSVNIIEFTLDDDVNELTLSVSLKGERMFPRNSGYSYSDSRMMLLKRDEDDPEVCELVVSPNTGRKRDNYLCGQYLDGGATYILYTEVDWYAQGMPQEYAITGYCPEEIKFFESQESQ